MEDKGRLSRGAFLSMAEASGLDVKDPYIDELYAYVEKIFPSFKVAERMDLSNVEPMTPFIPSKE